jgi:hypothetical protein
MKMIVLSYESPGRRAKAIFAMSHDDAMALCSDPRSKGKRWMTVFSPVEDWSDDGVVPSRFKTRDTGALDALIEDLGLVKYPI